MPQIAVLVADSQFLFAEALGAALERFQDLKIIPDRPGRGSHLMDAAQLWRPDVVLLEYWMTELEGPAATVRILTALPETKVILLGWFFGAREIQKGLDAGAVGFLPKSSSLSQVAEALRRAHAGEAPVFAEQLEKLTRTLDLRGRRSDAFGKRLKSLTPREIEILVTLSRGIPMEEAAAQLFISPGTLKVHVRNILAKTGARSHSEAVAMALRAGLIQL